MAVSSDKSEHPTIAFRDLEDAYDFVSSGVEIIEIDGYICRRTGKVYLDTHGEYDDENDPVPDDVGDPERFALIPGQYDLDLGQNLVFQFTDKYIPERYEQVSQFFRRSGAYRRFKDLLYELGKLDDWYTYETDEKESALRQWAEEEGFTVDPPAQRHLPQRVYQFRIVLAEVSPTIWRRIQVPESYSFWDLHVALQDSMGWLDCHLHEFQIPPNVRIGIPDEDFSGDTKLLAGWDTPVKDYVHEVGSVIEYMYDFGDDWHHLIELEGLLVADDSRSYPLCLDGARACPPEDCGGAHGYERLLKIISDPKDEQHDELLEWLGDGFDPERFSPSDVDFHDPAVRWKIAFEYD